MAGDVSPVAMFLKSRSFEDINYHNEGYVWGINWDIIWGMSGTLSEACLVHIWGMSWASSVACLEHHLVNVWGIIWCMSGASLGHICGMSGASSGVCLRHHLGHVWDNIFGTLSTIDNNGQQPAVLYASVMPFFYN